MEKINKCLECGKICDWNQPICDECGKEFMNVLSTKNYNKEEYIRLDSLWGDVFIVEKYRGIEKAIEVCDEILKINSKNIAALIFKKGYYLKLNQWVNAFECMEEIMEIKPDYDSYKRISFLCAFDFYDKKMYDEAIWYLDNILSIDGKNIEAVRLMQLCINEKEEE